MKKLAIIGATGLIGSICLKILEEENLNFNDYILFASSKSKNKKVIFMGKEYKVFELNKENIYKHKVDYALFFVNSNISKEFVKTFIELNTIVIDTSSYFRMEKNVPLIVPEINIKEINETTKLISSPSCSTIQAALPLKALEKYNLKRIIYSTYQAVSDAGTAGINDLISTRNGNKYNTFKYSINDNCIPQIDDFDIDNYTKEELKIINETRKILNKPNLLITCTCVRVPILNCHSESINIEFNNNFNLNDIINDLNNFEGIKVIDNIDNYIYPINEFANGKDDVLVGRIRRDYSVPYGINLWVVSDNLRKGAATNSIQILKYLLHN